MAERIDIIVSVDGAVTVKREIDDIGKSAKNTGNELTELKGILATVVSGATISSLANITSQWTDYQSRVDRAAGSTERGAAVMNRLVDIANRTYSALGTTAEGYLQNATSLQQLGFTTQQALDYTEALNNAMVVSGAKAQQAESVMNALSKAMAAGKLSGDNLNTVIESGGRIAELLAQKLNVSVNALRDMGTQGLITSKVLYESLAGSLTTLRAEAEAMPTTINDAMVILQNSIFTFIGSLNAATGASTIFSDAILFVANNVGLIAVALAPVIAGLVLFAGAAVLGFAITMMMQFVTACTAVVGALQLMAAFILANPITLIGVAIAGVIALMYQWRDSVEWIGAIFDWLAEKIGTVVNWIKEKLAEIGVFDGKNGNINVNLNDKASAPIKQTFKDGGKDAGKEMKDALKDASEDFKKKMKEGAKEAGGEMKQGVAAGGQQAGTTIGDKVAAAGSDMAALLVAALETGSAELWEMFKKMFDAQIALMEAETRKLSREADKLSAEASKLYAESRAIDPNRNGTHYPNEGNGLGAGGMGGGGTGGSGGNLTFQSPQSWYSKWWRAQQDRQAANFNKPSETSRTEGQSNFKELPTGTYSVKSEGGNTVYEPIPNWDTQDAKQDVNVNITNVTDPNDTANAIQTAKGRDSILNVIKTDPELFRNVLGIA